MFLLAALGVIQSCSQLGGAPAQRNSVPGPPTSCPDIAPVLRPINVGPLTQVIGRAPVWAAALDTTKDGRLPLLSIHGGSEMHAQDGYRVKVGWAIAPGFTRPVKVRGWDVQHRQLWFEVGNDPATQAPVLDPLHPQADVPPISEAGYAAFPSYVLVPDSGCYVLAAEWLGGGWASVVAAGANQATT